MKSKVSSAIVMMIAILMMIAIAIAKVTSRELRHSRTIMIAIVRKPLDIMVAIVRTPALNCTLMQPRVRHSPADTC